MITYILIREKCSRELHLTAHSTEEMYRQTIDGSDDHKSRDAVIDSKAAMEEARV